MTENEKHCIDLTVQLWNAFLKLPEQHSDDAREFRTKIHEIQHMLFARPTLREFN